MALRCFKKQMKIFFGFLLLFGFVIPTRADDLPNAPARQGASASPSSTAGEMASASQRETAIFPKKVFWPTVAALGTSAAFDAQMSRTYLVDHPNAHEAQSWLLGKRPSLGRYYATFAVMDGAAAVISYKLLHSHRKPVRVIGWSMIGSLTALHAYDDIVLAAR